MPESPAARSRAAASQANAVPLEQVRDALAHLHDPGRLQTHPLAALVGGSDRTSRGRALQRALLEAVDALKPSRDGAPRPKAVRQHQLLRRRYVDGLPWESVRGELLVSRSEYYRDHQQALEAVASLLGERLGAPPSGTAPAAPAPAAALPVYPTSFVGREAELADANRVLCGTQPAARLLTFTGTGGVGKTRVALEVAKALPGALFPDGVWLVELAPLTDAGRLPQAIAAALGLQEEPGRPFAEMLLDVCRPRRLLLVLDNCEHLVQACAELAHAILRTCPAVSIVATSREPLGIPGETVLGVPPLACPRGATAESLDELRRYDAVRLFTERAGAARSTLTLTPTDAAAVARICERLDGVPLALELAAAQVRVLSVEQIADRLDQSFRLLVVANRAAPPRQRTLEATLSWSYDLLSAPEQRLFARLGVFAGGCTFEAAEAVAAGGAEPADGEAAPSALDALASLVDKSLLVLETPPGRNPRVRMLETIRAYALERLLASGELEHAQRRHAAYFLGLAERLDAALWGPEPVARSQEVEPEHDNFRAALRGLIARREVAAALRLGAILARLWQMGSHLAEGRSWLRELLALPGGERVPERARVLVGAGLIASYQGDYPAAHGALAEGLALARELGDRPTLSHALFGLGLIAWLRGDYARARALGEEGAAAGRAVGHDPLAGLNLFVQAVGASEAADDGPARALAAEALRLCRGAGYHRGAAGALAVLGRVAHRQGAHAEARALLEEALARCRAARFPVGVAWVLAQQGWLSAETGQPAAARRLFEESLALYRELGLAARLPSLLEGLARAAAAEGRAAAAVRLVGAAEAARLALSAPRSPAEEAQLRPWLAASRRALGPAAADAAWAAGLALPLPEAIASALEEGRRPSGRSARPPPRPTR